jgi:hypothetical protein
MVVEPERCNDNDDRIICRMDVEGMPQRGFAWNFMRQRREEAAAWPASHPSQLTRSEARKYIRYSVLAGLSIVLVYTVTLVLFILFCNNIWFR